MQSKDNYNPFLKGLGKEIAKKQEELEDTAKYTRLAVSLILWFAFFSTVVVTVCAIVYGCNMRSSFEEKHAQDQMIRELKGKDISMLSSREIKEIQEKYFDLGYQSGVQDGKSISSYSSSSSSYSAPISSIPSNLSERNK